VAVAAVVIVGKGFTVTVKVVPLLTQPLAFVTVIVPVYVPAFVLAGTDIVMGLAGRATFVTAAKLFAGAGFQVIL
jgi:hypothetical protein